MRSVEIKVLECVRNLHPDFHPRLTTDASLDGLRVGSLGFFSDIFFIVFDNVRKHAGMLEPQVTVSATLNGRRLDVRIVNELAATAITPERERQVEEIRAAIAQGEGEYLRAVRSEGGTGLKKLRNILRRVAKQPEFGFIDRTFFVRFDVPIIEVAEERDEKAANA